MAAEPHSNSMRAAILRAGGLLSGWIGLKGKGAAAEGGKMRMIGWTMRMAALFGLFGLVGLAGAATIATAAPLEPPFASATLYYDGATGGVAVLETHNVDIQIAPGDDQDLKIARAFHLICHLPANLGLRRIGVWAARPWHLIPSDVVDYHTFDPSYVALDIDTSFFENRDDRRLLANHEIHVDFFVDP